MKKKNGLKIHKMGDWKQYRVNLYGRLIRSGEIGGLEARRIAFRVQENNWGIYESLKTYDNGVAYNDGSWLIFSTSRTYKDKDKVLYKDKVFCKDKSQVIADLYCYILFLRKIGIDVVYEMNYYAVAFLTKYLRFLDKVFECTRKNQMKIGELCQAAFKKDPDEIDCESRKDTRKFAFDPDMTRRMKQADIIRLQNKIEKQIKDELIKKWYAPSASLRDNIKMFKDNGINDVSLPRLHQWVKEYIKV